MTKREALAKFLGEEIEEEGAESYLGAEGAVFDLGKREYLVLTDEEADDAVREYIKESIWAFTPEFIIEHSKTLSLIPDNYNYACETSAIRSLRSIQEKCESSNPFILALIDDFEEFCEDAVSADGRGHFLAGYDGHENEEGEFFIYRTN